MLYSSEVAVRNAIGSLLKTSRRHPKLYEPGDKVAARFVQKHPWARKFLCVGYAEADYFSKFARGTGIKVQKMKRSEVMRTKFPGRLTYLITGHGRRYAFTFTRPLGGKYEYNMHSVTIN